MAAPWSSTIGFRALFLSTLLFFQHVRISSALQVDVGSISSLKDAAKALADSCMAFYDGDKPGGVPGLLPASVSGTFNWWQAGALWGQMIEYWYYTGDDRYNQLVSDALIAQKGENNNFEPTNQTRTEGNDDQAFWALAAMTAAETKFPDRGGGDPSWLGLAQAVFNRQAARWDMDHCNGGLRWQFNPFNNGYMEKNTISNGCFFQLAARLARYTKNETYADWATKTYDWLTKTSPLITQHFEVYDSVPFTEQSCNGKVGDVQWTYNIGTMIAGVAFMYDHTSGATRQKWGTEMDGYMKNLQRVFFPDQYGGKVMVEYACEPIHNCNRDQRSFKAYLSRWLALSYQLVPATKGQITTWIQASTQGVAKACSNTAKGLACGRTWYDNKDDGERDIGNQMTAMSMVQSNFIFKSPATLADISSGNSKSDPGAGGKGAPTYTPDAIYTRKITMADKAGAWILTVLAVLVSVFGMFALLVEGDNLKEYTGLLGSGRSRFSWTR